MRRNRSTGSKNLKRSPTDGNTSTTPEKYRMPVIANSHVGRQQRCNRHQSRYE